MYKKKLIETSIPLDDINRHAIREKSLRKGHPSTLHLWWARRPLAAARCVIFASMVDDPAEHPELFPTEEDQDKERERLHNIIRALANWDNINNRALYEQAYAEMVKYAPDGKLPEFLDPFAGGGALPLEAQRLGLVAHAADLNPIPVTLNRAMIDIPHRFNGKPPVCPRNTLAPDMSWSKATGLAEDVDYYSAILRKKAIERLGGYYPDVVFTKGAVEKKATPIAYFWTRTVTCPNPACKKQAPLMRSFILAKKKGRRVYLEPIVSNDGITYEIRSEANGWKDFSAIPEKTVGRKGAVCIHCGSPISLDYIRTEGKTAGLGAEMIAIACESPFDRGRWYAKPDKGTLEAVKAANPLITGALQSNITANPRDFKTPNYGLTRFQDLYNQRQIFSLITLTELVSEMRGVIEADALHAGMSDDAVSLNDGGCGAKAYAEAVSVYLACIVDKLSDYCSTICTWHNGAAHEKISHVFARQAVPMTWDFTEVNPLSTATGSFNNMSKHVSDVLRDLPANPEGEVSQRDAAQTRGLSDLLISTDPPYYDNIGYADLSDYFYVWLRRSIRDVYPDVFSTVLTPKREELVATPYRFAGGAEEAKSFFEDGMRETFKKLAIAASDTYPLTIYYAYKQSENTSDGRTSSGWETMLQALMDANLQITGTWPMRTEMSNRVIGLGSNALASSIVLVCRKRLLNAPVATRPEFLRELRRMLRDGVKDLQRGAIAPVDMAQASIGPGMAAFSKYAQVIESDGRPMTVHTALGIINEQLDALMGESGEEFDNETRFCLTWYEQFGFTQGDFGSAETIRNARGASLEGLVQSGVLESGHGKTRLLNPIEATSVRQTHMLRSAWIDLMEIIAALESSEGLTGAAKVVNKLDTMRTEKAKTLAYILFQMAERHGRTEDADVFNRLVTSWMDVAEKGEDLRRNTPEQQQLDLDF